MVAFLAVVFTGIWFTTSRGAARRWPTSGRCRPWRQRAGDRLPPLPRLQTRPAADLTAFRASEDLVLQGYAWVDQETGVVRIPVARAIELIAQRGLPAMPAAPASTAPPADAAPAAASPR